MLLCSKKIILVYFTLLALHIAKAQKQTIIIKCTDSIQLQKTASTSFLKNKNQQQTFLDEYLVTIKSNGFITAAFDSIIDNQNITTAYLFLGNKYTWKNIILPQELLFLKDETSIENIPKKAIDFYINNGYPFAKISFDSVSINNKNEINATLKVNKGYPYKLDSIRIIGDASISQNFLEHFLQLPKKTVFNQTVLDNIDKKLATLNFLQLTQATSITMINTGYLVNLYLNQKKVNRFDIICGFLPNNNQNNGKLLFTIDANIGLVNAFGKAETITFMWQQIQPQSPRIDVGFTMPYVFKTQAQFNFKFNIYKRDSAFLNINTDVGLTYNVGDKSKFNIYVNSFSSRIITPDTVAIISTKKLPAFLDMGITNLGIGYSYNENINTNINKQKGFEFYSNLSFGTKTISPNTTITSLKTSGFNYNSLYDSINKNSYQLKAKIIATKYFNISKFATLKMSANAALIQTAQVLQNEQYQIGGFKLLRGFDEENIFTNKYMTTLIEYRYALNNSSYFYLFNDAAFINNNILNKNYNYVSGGLGLALNTKQGILNFCIAAGKRNDLPFNLRETKIHVGLINNL